MANLRKVLVAFSDPEGRESLIRLLGQCGLEPVFTSTVKDAQAVLAKEPISMVFCQDRLADGGFGDILRATEPVASKIPVVVCSPFYDKSLYTEAMWQGAQDFMVYPYRREELEWIVGNALHKAPQSAPKVNGHAA